LRRRIAAERREAGAADRARRVEAGMSLLARRQTMGLSIERLAKLVGASPAHVSRVERGLNVPSEAMLARFAAVLSTSQPAGQPDRPDFGSEGVDRAA
jgi:transcriptional regulator with XRE-family HTH domain